MALCLIGWNMHRTGDCKIDLSFPLPLPLPLHSSVAKPTTTGFMTSLSALNQL